MTSASFCTADGGARRLLEALFSGDPSSALSVLGADARLDVPRFDQVAGAEAIGSLVRQWAEAYPYELVDVTVFNIIDSTDGFVTELRTRMLDAGREFPLPIAVVESVESGARLVRLYHSERLIHGERRGRRPVWPADPDQEPTPVAEVHSAVGSYMAAIASGDEGAVVARFADGGVLDNGVRPVKEPQELQSIFRAMVRTGGARLVRRREFDDGAVVAFEYTGLPRPAVDGGAPRTPPGGGVGIYAYDDDDRICAVRMYDDFDPEMLIAVGSST